MSERERERGGGGGGLQVDGVDVADMTLEGINAYCLIYIRPAIVLSSACTRCGAARHRGRRMRRCADGGRAEDIPEPGGRRASYIYLLYMRPVIVPLPHTHGLVSSVFTDMCGPPLSSCPLACPRAY